MARDEAYRIAEQKIEEARRSGASELNLTGLGVIKLPESLGQLTKLQSLDASVNDLTTLPESLGQLKQLQVLYIHLNRLTSLADYIFDLKKLEYLCLAGNPMQILSDKIGELRKLRSLTLGGTEVQVLPESFSRLAKLEFLSLGDTPLTELPEWIGNLKSLRGLDLSKGVALILEWQENRKSWSLSQIKNIVRGLDRLPESLRQIPRLSELFLHGNSSLELPVEILGPDCRKVFGAGKSPTCPADILDYYFRSRRGRRPLNEAKLILVGRGGVGKTCLIKRLIHGTFDEHEAETPGIEIQPWEVTLDPKQAHLDLAVVHLEVFLDFCSQNLVTRNQYLLDSS